MSDQCVYCGADEQTRDLRPYGPGGAWVCFPCAMATPEREQEAHNAFDALFTAACEASPVVQLGSKHGPTPLS